MTDFRKMTDATDQDLSVTSILKTTRSLFIPYSTHKYKGTHTKEHTLSYVHTEEHQEQIHADDVGE